MNLEGRIDIHLERHGDAPATVAIHSTRPQLAQKLLAGRAPEAAAHLAGLVFSLCGKAQRVACEAACEAALGSAGVPPASRARETAVLLELAQEHAWRLLLDWPQQQGMPPDQASQLRLRQRAADPARFAETLDELLRTTLLGEPADIWLARDLAGFDAWRHGSATPTARLFSGLGEGADSGISEVALLPPLGNLEAGEALELARQALEQPAFCGQPLWRGAPAETGALARAHEKPLLAAWIARRGRGAGARLLARLLELAELPARLSDLCSAGKDVGATGVRAWSLGDHVGLAGVETSRGLLLHAVRLRGGKVAEYRIVAPTEWNFHPAGPLFQALSGLDRARDRGRPARRPDDAAETAALPLDDAAALPLADLEARARLVAQSLDPCVAFAIEVTDAK